MAFQLSNHHPAAKKAATAFYRYYSQNIGFDDPDRDDYLAEFNKEYRCKVEYASSGTFLTFNTGEDYTWFLLKWS